MICVGVIGYGYWGPNIVRNFNNGDHFPGGDGVRSTPRLTAQGTTSLPTNCGDPRLRELINSPDIDAVAVVTPVWTHFELAKAALENGKHVFVEKPFTSTVAQAEELIELAEQKNLQIMVDHTFLFTGAVKKIRQLIDAGRARQALLLRFHSGESRPVSTRCQRHLGSGAARPLDHGLPDRGEAGRRCRDRPETPQWPRRHGLHHHLFPDNIIAHINVNWLSPVKIRTTLIGGEKKMVVWNDLEADEKIRVYDKGVEITQWQRACTNSWCSYRSGDMWAPQGRADRGAEDGSSDTSSECINNDRTPFNDGESGFAGRADAGSSEPVGEAQGSDGRTPERGGSAA